MKTFVSLTAFTALLGACTSTSTAPTVGSAVYDTSVLPIEYTVTQNGTTYSLLTTDPRFLLSQNDATIFQWVSGGVNTSGYARAITTIPSADGTYGAVAAGLDNGTYFAGVSGTLSDTVQNSGTANYTGIYGFVVNGVDLTGPLELTANFGTGSLVDTSAGIDVVGTFTGASFEGTVTIAGQSGTLKGGIYNYNNGAVEPLAGAAVGSNMAGIIYAKK